MKIGVKIAIATSVAAALGTAGYFILRPKKEETSAGDTVVPPALPPVEPVVPILPPTITTPPVYTPSVPPLATAGIGTMSAPVPITTPTPTEPTPTEYIRMADRWMTWENIWKFADKLGVTDKDKVGGTVGANDKGIISHTSRKNFSEISRKFPDWKTLLKRKAAEKGIALGSSNYATPEDYFNSAQSYIKSTYGYDMASFNGKNAVNDFFTGK